MSQWAWVALGYGVATVSIAVYLISLARRWTRARRRMGQGQ